MFYANNQSEVKSEKYTFVNICMYTLKLFAFIEEAFSKFSYFQEKVSGILFH